MTTLDDLHRAYMRDLENDYEARQTNEYCNTGDDVVELESWSPVAKPENINILQRVIKGRL